MSKKGMLIPAVIGVIFLAAGMAFIYFQVLEFQSRQDRNLEFELRSYSLAESSFQALHARLAFEKNFYEKENSKIYAFGKKGDSFSYSLQVREMDGYTTLDALNKGFASNHREKIEHITIFYCSFDLVDTSGNPAVVLREKESVDLSRMRYLLSFQDPSKNSESQNFLKNYESLLDDSPQSDAEILKWSSIALENQEWLNAIFTLEGKQDEFEMALDSLSDPQAQDFLSLHSELPEPKQGKDLKLLFREHLQTKSKAEYERFLLNKALDELALILRSDFALKVEPARKRGIFDLYRSHIVDSSELSPLFEKIKAMGSNMNVAGLMDLLSSHGFVSKSGFRPIDYVMSRLSPFIEQGRELGFYDSTPRYPNPPFLLDHDFSQYPALPIAGPAIDPQLYVYCEDLGGIITGNVCELDDDTIELAVLSETHCHYTGGDFQNGECFGVDDIQAEPTLLSHAVDLSSADPVDDHVDHLNAVPALHTTTSATASDLVSDGDTDDTLFGFLTPVLSGDSDLPVDDATAGPVDDPLDNHADPKEGPPHSDHDLLASAGPIDPEKAIADFVTNFRFEYSTKVMEAMVNSPFHTKVLDELAKRLGKPKVTKKDLEVYQMALLNQYSWEHILNTSIKAGITPEGSDSFVVTALPKGYEEAPPPEPPKHNDTPPTIQDSLEAGSLVKPEQLDADVDCSTRVAFGEDC